MRAGIEGPAQHRTRGPAVCDPCADDGLVPQAFSSAPYVAMAQDAGRDVPIGMPTPQHFDAFLASLNTGGVLPLLPMLRGAGPVELLSMAMRIAHGCGERLRPRAGKPLQSANLAIPR